MKLLYEKERVEIWKKEGICVIVTCVTEAGMLILKVMIMKLFYKCCINNAIDGTEDAFAFIYERDDENSSIPNLFFVIRKKQKWTSIKLFGDSDSDSDFKDSFVAS